MRREDWPERLAEVLARRAPFAWGKNDCCLFAADAIATMTGVDPAWDYRGRYKTAAGALRRLGRGGVAALAERIAGRYEWPETPVLMARRGDVALVPGEGPFGGALGVVTGAGVAVFGESGLAEVPRRMAARAWRID